MQEKLKIFTSESTSKMDLDIHCTKVSSFLIFLTTTPPNVRSDIFILPEMLPIPSTSTYVLATIFAKSISRPIHKISKVIRFPIIDHPLIADICLKLLSLSLCLLSRSTF